jgi:hypothetical protein
MCVVVRKVNVTLSIALPDTFLSGAEITYSALVGLVPMLIETLAAIRWPLATPMSLQVVMS